MYMMVREEKKNENRKFLKSRNVIIEMCERKKKSGGCTYPQLLRVILKQIKKYY